jgi:hypothetical protein
MLEQPLMRFQERLLHYPGEVDPVAQMGSDLQSRQQRQVGAEPLQVLGLERPL